MRVLLNSNVSPERLKDFSDFFKSFQSITRFHVPITKHLVGNWVECGLLCYGAQPGLLVLFLCLRPLCCVPRDQAFHSVFRGQTASGSSRDANDLKQKKIAQSTCRIVKSTFKKCSHSNVQTVLSLEKKTNSKLYRYHFCFSSWRSFGQTAAKQNWH